MRRTLSRLVVALLLTSGLCAVGTSAQAADLEPARGYHGPLPVAPETPPGWGEPDRVEVDVGRQLLFIVRDGEVAGILPVSTGGGYTYFSDLFKRDKLAYNPHADFTLNWHQLGWSYTP